MKFTSILAIYVLFWWLCLFLVLPLRLKRRGGAPEIPVAGEMPGAPPRFSLGRTLLWTTILSLSVFFLFYLNYVEGWVGPGAFDFYSAYKPTHFIAP